MEKAQREIGLPASRFIWLDLMQGSPVRYMEYWSTFSQTGVNGDPTLATSEKGEKIFNAVVDRLIALTREFRSRSRGQRVDHHEN